MKCEMWLSEVLSPEGFQSTQIKIEDLIQIWKFGSDRGKMLFFLLEMINLHV